MAFSIYDDPSRLAREVEEALRASASKTTPRNLLILLGSLVLFVVFLSADRGPVGIVVLVGVLFIHELGHLVAMRVFGYRDVQMFFIPFFGAAVSGVESSPNGTKRAIVALAGPVPGIVLGVICARLFHATGQELFKTAARDFLFINTFNLLPFVPLDGGRYLEAVLFARHPILRVVADCVAVVALGSLMFLLKSPLFAVLAIFVLRSVPQTYRAGKLAGELKRELSAQPAVQTDAGTHVTYETIPPQYVERLTPLIATHLPEAQQTDPKVIAVALRRVWSMVWFTPPSLVAAAGLLAAFIICFAGGVILTVGAELSFRPPSTEVTAISTTSVLL